MRDDMLDLSQFMGVATHAIDQHQVWLLVFGDAAHPALSAVNQNHSM